MLAAILTTFAKSHSPQRGPGIANRLWAYQLQEEALKKNEKVDEPTGGRDDVQVVARPSKKRSKLVVPKRSARVEKIREESETLEPIPFVRKAIQTYPSAYEELSALEPISLTFASVLTLRKAIEVRAVIDFEQERIKRHRRARRRAAVFLLLAA